MLSLAAANGHLDTAKYLIEQCKGKSINKQQKRKLTLSVFKQILMWVYELLSTMQ